MKWLRFLLSLPGRFIEAMRQEDRDRQAHRAAYQELLRRLRQQPEPRRHPTGNVELDPVTGRVIPKQSEF